ncbi:MAG: 5'-deoxynucleotidase [Chloroflexota bacterium]
MQEVSHFFAYMHRLRYIRRWSLMRNTDSENVAEHSFQVALITHALCTIARTQFGKDVSPNAAAVLALFHDVDEVITGDIATPVKHHNPAILRSFREVEDLAAERLFNMLPESLRGSYRGLLLKSHADESLLEWVRAADRIAAYLKCAGEVASGNRDFLVAMKQTGASLTALGMQEVEYFLKTFAPSFEKTLDELSE